MGSVPVGSLPSSFLLGLASKGTEDQSEERKSVGYHSSPSLPAAGPCLGCPSNKGHTQVLSVCVFMQPHLWVLVALCLLVPGVNGPHCHIPGVQLCPLLPALDTASVCVSSPFINCSVGRV